MSSQGPYSNESQRRRCHDGNRGWRDARKDCYRAGCPTCTEASTMVLALEERKSFIARLTSKGTEGSAQICLSHPGFRAKFKGELGKSWLASLKSVHLEADFPYWRTSHFVKGSSGNISILWVLQTQDSWFRGHPGAVGSHLARSHCCLCKITTGLNNQQPVLRKQSQFKLVSVLCAVSISPYFFIHSSILKEIGWYHSRCFLLIRSMDFYKRNEIVLHLIVNIHKSHLELLSLRQSSCV